MVGSRYNPFLLQSLERLRPGELLEVLGAISVRLAMEFNGKALAKEQVIENLQETLKEIGLGRVVERIASRANPLLVNDLRRLGLVVAGNAESEWRQNEAAQVTAVAKRAADAIMYCRRHCRNEHCNVIGGAVVIASFLLGVSAGSPGLREVLLRLWREEEIERVSRDVASRTGMDAGRARLLIKGLQNLLVRVRSVLKDAAVRGCVPRLYVPLGIA